MVLQGAKGTVAFAIRTNGTAEAAEFLSGLDTLNQQRFHALLRLACDQGYVRSPDQYNKLSSEIGEFKRGPFRLLFFRIGATWYLTHGFRKKQQKCPRSELDRAERIHQEHLSRRAGRR